MINRGLIQVFVKRSPSNDPGRHTQMLKTYYGNIIYAIKRYIKIMHFMFF